LPLAPRAKPRAGDGKSIGSHLDEVRKIILNLAFLGVVGLLIFTAVKVLRSDEMVVDAIGLPKNIRDLGYTEDGAALMLSDNIRRIVGAANDSDAQLQVLANYEVPDIAVPVEGLSFGSIIRLLRQTFGLPQNRLIGDFVCPSEPCLSSTMELRMRLRQGVNKPVALSPVRGTSHDAILQSAAERFMEATAPMELALYLHNEPTGARRAEGVAIAQQIALTDNENRLTAINLLGVDLLERPEKRPEDLKAAIAYFQQVIEAEPNAAIAYTNWGAALSALGDKAGAIEKYRQSIALNSDEAMQHHNLGVVLASQGQDAEAVTSFETAVALDPGYANSYLGLGSAQLRLGNAAAALASFEKAAALNPQLADAQYNIGVAARNADKPLAARQAFEAYLRLNPTATDRETVQGFITELSGP
jgi:tetratricopeptide (TPR) repeat protein